MSSKRGGKFMKKGLKYVFHETLEGGRCMVKAKGHHQELIMAFINVNVLGGIYISFERIW
jgi:hypothetical protein